MIAVAKPSAVCQPVSWQAGFLDLLPGIAQHAGRAFRHLTPEAKEDALAEVVANTLCAYRRLHERGALERAFPTTLVDYAVRQYYAGRRVGSRLTSHDISSQHCQRKTGVVLESPDWQDVLVEDRHAGPAEIAASRIDVGAWLASLPKRTRRVAECLATGESTSSAAKAFGLTPGRISQFRRELYSAWLVFQGDGSAERCPAAT
jgi:hypothetical protein